MYPRIFLILFIYLAMFWLGYQRKPLEKWAAAKYNTAVYHHSDVYPTKIRDVKYFLFANYKILFSFIFYGSFIVLNLVIALLAFPTKEMMLSLTVIYTGLLMLSILFISMGFIFNSYTIGFGLVQSFKKLISTPFISILLIVYFWKFKNSKSSASNNN